jgi:hypothetical protein
VAQDQNGLGVPVVILQGGRKVNVDNAIRGAKKIRNHALVATGHFTNGFEGRGIHRASSSFIGSQKVSLGVE